MRDAYSGHLIGRQGVPAIPIGERKKPSAKGNINILVLYLLPEITALYNKGPIINTVTDTTSNEVL